MPTYLIHGFRWSRPLVRIHIASNSLDDCCAEWLVEPVSIRTLLNNFYTNYDFLPPCQQPTPHSSHPSSNNSSSSLAHHSNASHSTITGPGPGTGKGSVTASRTLKRNGQNDGTELTGFNAWSAVKVLEQYSEKSLVVSHPYAYIGDYILPITLSADIAKEMFDYEQRQRAEREKLERETRDALDAFAPTSDLPPSDSSGAQNGQPQPQKRKGPPVTLRPAGNGTTSGSSPSPSASGASTPSRRPSISRLRRQERQLDWISQLRDRLQPSAEMGWYVVIVDDEERKLDDAYEPFESEYIPIVPSQQASVAGSREIAQSASSQAGGEGDGNAEGARSGVESAMSNHSRVMDSARSPADETANRQSSQSMKRRGSIARLRGLFGLKEKSKSEKESRWEGAAEWEKMQRRQRAMADSESVKQPFPPGWEKSGGFAGGDGEEGGLRSPMGSTFERPGTGDTADTARQGRVRPNSGTGRLSKLRK